MQKKIKLKDQDDKGATAVHLAAGNGYQEIVRALVERGADVNLKDSNGRMARMLMRWMTPEWCCSTRGKRNCGRWPSRARAPTEKDLCLGRYCGRMRWWWSGF